MPSPKAIRIDPAAAGRTPLLTGPPETATMQSGLMVLLPSQSVGKHSTGDNEEAIVVLAGTGKMLLPNGRILELEPDTVAYCPKDLLAQVPDGIELFTALNAGDDYRQVVRNL